MTHNVISGPRIAALRKAYSITSSARSSIEVGTAMPIAFAALRLTIVVNLVARSIGRSAGLAPLSILSTSTAAWCHIEEKSTP